MTLFCEISFRKILPAVRSVLAEELVKKGLKQEEIATELGLTQPAICNYLKKARGKKAVALKRNKKIKKLIEKTAEDIKEKKIKNKEVMLCRICNEIRTLEVIK